MKGQQNDIGKYLFYLFGIVAVAVAAGIALIPSTMVYKLRLFDGVGLPPNLVEFVRFVIVFATPLSVVIIGLIRVFGVSDETHEYWLTVSMVLEIVSMVCEIVASLANGSDWMALIAQGVFLSVAIVSIFLAVSFSITKSGWFKMAIAANNRSLTWDAAYNDLFMSRIQSPESIAKMQDMIDAQISQRATNATPKLEHSFGFSANTATPTDDGDEIAALEKRLAELRRPLAQTPRR